MLVSTKGPPAFRQKKAKGWSQAVVALNVVAEVEDRFGARPALEQGLLFMVLEGLEVLRNVHGEAEIFFVARRDGCRDGMR